MTKRERQYTDWNKFWRKVRSSPKPTFTHFTEPVKGYLVTGLVFRRIRVPDTMLKIMEHGRK